jgi:hypothetical protein
MTDHSEHTLRPELVSLFTEFCEALQNVINAGADVHTQVNGTSAAILNTRVASTLGIKVNYITRESPAEQEAIVSPFAHFDIAFTDV